MGADTKGDIWIGLVNVAPLPNCTELKGVDGAYVNVIAKVKNADEFLELMNNEFSKRNFRVIDIDDVELFSVRENKYQLRGEIQELAREVKTNGTLGIDTYHTYMSDGN